MTGHKTITKPEDQEQPRSKGLDAMSCSMPIYQSTPDEKWHCSVRSPEGYGFDLAFDSEADFISLLDSLKECAGEPEGLAAHLQHTTEVLASNSEDHLRA